MNSYTPITLDKVRNFRYDTKALMFLEKQLSERAAVEKLSQLQKNINILTSLQNVSTNHKDSIDEIIKKSLESIPYLNTKVSILDLDVQTMSIEQLYILVQAGLIHEDAELTLEKLIDIVDAHSSLGEVSEIAVKAMTNSFGDADEKNVNRAARRQKK